KNNNQKTAKMAASGLLADLPIGKPDKLNFSIADEKSLSSPYVDNSIEDVEIGGVEPPKHGLSGLQGKPAIPTSDSLYQNNTQNAIVRHRPIFLKT
ncbi:hypothetical protein KJ854_05255, partial [Patescibacteria group bacterium]|nr:hypothetical protein [Patescibacteria group bacterium]